MSVPGLEPRGPVSLPRLHFYRACLVFAAGLEQQAVSYTVEVITVSMLKARGEKSQENVSTSIRLGWTELTLILLPNRC